MTTTDSKRKETAMERLLRKRREARSDAMVKRHAQAGNTSVRTPKS